MAGQPAVIPLALLRAHRGQPLLTFGVAAFVVAELPCVLRRVVAQLQHMPVVAARRRAAVLMAAARWPEAEPLRENIGDTGKQRLYRPPSPFELFDERGQPCLLIGLRLRPALVEAHKPRAGLLVRRSHCAGKGASLRWDRLGKGGSRC